MVGSVAGEHELAPVRPFGLRFRAAAKLTDYSRPWLTLQATLGRLSFVRFSPALRIILPRDLDTVNGGPIATLAELRADMRLYCGGRDALTVAEMAVATDMSVRHFRRFDDLGLLPARDPSYARLAIPTADFIDWVFARRTPLRELRPMSTTWGAAQELNA